jgi:hypothetical protein
VEVGTGTLRQARPGPIKSPMAGLLAANAEPRIRVDVLECTVFWVSRHRVVLRTTSQKNPGFDILLQPILTKSRGYIIITETIKSEGSRVTTNDSAKLVLEA